MNYGLLAVSVVFKIKKFILDTIFPVECLGCGKEGDWLCDGCREKIRPDVHLRCGENLEKILTFYSYDNEILKRAIHLLKYKNIKDLSIPLGEMLAEHLKEKIENREDDIVIVPVPLHRKRLRERGYNQAELLAQKVAEKFFWEMDGATLIRKKYTRPQVDLKEEERSENIKGAFAVIDGLKIKDKKIIVIDDVLTTGATMEECACILKCAGAKEVWGVALAKG